MDTQTASLEPYQIARQVTAAVRSLNHATSDPGDDWQYPSHVSMTLSALATAAEYLPQAIAQCNAAIARAQSGGHLYCHEGGVGEWTKELGVDLEAAANAAQVLCDRLRAAELTVGMFGYKD